MHLSSILTLAVFGILSLSSCDKNNVAITPESSGKIESTDLQSATAVSGAGVTNASAEPQALDFTLKGDVIYDITEIVSTGGAEPTSTYVLNGDGKGQSENFGDALITNRLVVDGETGATRGFVKYDFPNEGITLRFKLYGNLNIEAGTEYAVLVSRLQPQNSSGINVESGFGETLIFDDLFLSIPDGPQAKARIVTKAQLNL